MTNITIANNIIEGREPAAVRVRLFSINLQSGDKQPTNDVFDVQPGQEERVNLSSPAIGFEVRTLVPGSSYADDEPITPDVFGKQDAFERLKTLIKSIPTIRADMTLSDTERDTKAAAVWAEALGLAKQ